MPRVNWNAYDRQEQAIIDDDSLTQAEKMKRINDLNRELREEYQEQQDKERRDEFGW